MTQPASKWTAEMVRALPDDRKRYEVVDGELLVTASVSWQHQDAIGGLLLDLGRYLDEIERWRPGTERAEVLGETIEWRPDPAHPALVIELAKYFADVIGE